MNNKKELKEVLSAIRNTEKEGLTPDQRKYAKAYAARLELIIDAEDISELNRFISDLNKDRLRASYYAKRHVARICYRKLDSIVNK